MTDVILKILPENILNCERIVSSESLIEEFRSLVIFSAAISSR